MEVIRLIWNKSTNQPKVIQKIYIQINIITDFYMNVKKIDNHIEMKYHIYIKVNYWRWL